jgi:hypothetical protein
MLIAGVSIGALWHRLTPGAKPDKGYEEFLLDSSPEAPDIRVDVYPLSEAPFHPPLAKKVFDSEQSWSLYREGTEHWLCLDPPLHNQGPVWLAKFDPAVTRVEVFVGALEGSKPDDPVRYPLDQLLIIYHLAQRSGLLVHAAGAAFSDVGLVFPGKSRAGKSTLSRQLLADQRIELLSDDRVIIRRIDGAFQAFGTPWPGEAGIAKNRSAPLRSLLFLNQSPDNRIEPISPQDALEKLAPVASIPWYDEQLLPQILGACEELLNTVPAYGLYFRPDSSVVDLLTHFADHQKSA